jgi:hypothetical protein
MCESGLIESSKLECLSRNLYFCIIVHKSIVLKIILIRKKSTIM